MTRALVTSAYTAIRTFQRNKMNHPHHHRRRRSLVAVATAVSVFSLLSDSVVLPCHSYLLLLLSSSSSSSSSLSSGRCHNAAFISTRPSVALQKGILPKFRHGSRSTLTAAFSTAGGGGGSVNIRHIGKQEMMEIMEDFKQGGRELSQYCVIDVRTDPEVQATGKLADNVPTLPIQVILQTNAFAMDEDDFEEAFGFAKPQLDETLVFSCAAGIRSNYACQAAAAAGYTNLINYVGGANEWFYSEL